MNNQLIKAASLPLTVLLVPLVAMQITNEVKWDIFDFIVGGLLLSITGVAVHLATSKVGNSKKRNIILLLIILTFGLLWGELAVGIFDSPIAGS